MKMFKNYMRKIELQGIINQKRLLMLDLTVKEAIEAFKLGIRLRENEVPHVY